MPSSSGPLTADFKAKPYWWEAAAPDGTASGPLPGEADVVVVGSGFAGLCCALELAEGGHSVVVLDAEELGAGASTRSGAMVTGGQKLVVTDAITGLPAERQAEILHDAKESLSMMEERVSRYMLDADYHLYGRLIVAHVPKHMEKLTRWAELLRSRAGSEVEVLSTATLRTELDSPRYYGGILIKDYGGIHPAKYHRALREAARARGVSLQPYSPATAIRRSDGGFVVATPRGEIRSRHVMVGTNAYTGDVTPWMQRRVIPVGAYAVATEPLPGGMASELIPRARMVSDTQRDLFWFRQSPDGTRIIFGARPYLRETTPEAAAPVLHRMLASVFPRLAGVRISHGWRGNVGMSADHVPHMGVHDGVHYALACNGSGVAMMSYLGFQTARKIMGRQNRPCAFDRESFPAVPLYNGNPWFVPIVSGWYRMQDKAEQVAARLL
ncbi:FAD-binding oxidoreductase [Roseomonas sp. E05]|uniref:NAD(P)/FAD-dependent oxidoreductase n=1 Tax=Roseomonas sp. E05 TaxID=3046310 RepID=UPI0024B9D66F|nr:FAD-binding oxidoreductase [Roseomonas sp. E05]MDJ0391050.1 FAD-binding oxidoreductase [Roseomonas sp. E05]